MKKFVLSVAALAITAAGASAADMAVKAPVYRPAPIVDPWVGFYVGANVGYSWGDWRADSNQRVYNFEQFTARPKVDGVLGGVQAGFNWRVAPQWLFGIEADIQATDEKARQTWIDPGLPNTLPPPPPPEIIGDFVRGRAAPRLSAMNGNSRGSERCACERAIILRQIGCYTSPVVWPMAEPNITLVLPSREQPIISRPAQRRMRFDNHRPTSGMR